LLDVTAFLSNPAMALVVAGVLGMSPAGPSGTALTVSDALARPSVSIESGPVNAGAFSGAEMGSPDGVPEPFIGPDPVGGGSSFESTARLGGVALLEQLSRLSASELSDFVEAYPTALDELTTSPPLASTVAGWWASTTVMSRTTLADDIPGVIGNLEGLPYTVRDVANRAFLAATARDIHSQLDAGVGRAMQDELEARLEMLASVERSLVRGASGEPRTLITLDVTGEGRAVVGIGSLADADYVTFFIPGMYVGVTQQIVDWTGNAETALIEQQAWLDRLHQPGLQQPGLNQSSRVATVAWIGYHTPTLVNIAGMDLAYEGRDALTRSLQGLDAVSASDPFVSIVAHSYGSTAAMLALEENDVSVDALIMVGSPGSPATSVDDLKVTDGNVWVAASDSDPIPRSGVFGSQPLDADFGAHRFSVHAMTDPLTGAQLTDITGHVYYFWPGTTSVRNTALIAIDQGALVSTDDVVSRASAAR
jgi:hypothetical protein